MTVPEEMRLPSLDVPPSRAFDVYLYATTMIPGAGTDPAALDPYTPAVRGLFAAYLLDGEIGNGGFSQVLFNGLGVWFDEALAGLETAGLDAHRQVMVEAADYGITLLAELRKARTGATLESYAEWADTSGFEPFDDRWYELPSIDTGFDRFLGGHADEIWEPE